jgi:hypothetical protein
MLPYYFIFFIALVFSLSPVRLNHDLKFFVWIFVFIFGVLFIGLRHEVGGDWPNYLNNVESVGRQTILEVLGSFGKKDVGYQLINYISYNLGLGIYGVNILSGSIVMLCLLFFASKQPYPWLVIAISIPFFIIGINMGTVRQGLALSIILVGLTHIEKSSARYIFYNFLALLFHKTAIVMFLMLIFKIKFKSSPKSWFAIAIFIAILASVGGPAFEIFYKSYILDDRYQSSGAIVRVLISLAPFGPFLFFYPKLRALFPDNWIYLWMGVGCFMLLLLAPFLSTAVDRLAYYTLPMQLAIWPRVIYLIQHEAMKAYIAILVLFTYLMILFVWLNFANHSWAWIPYKTIFG